MVSETCEHHKAVASCPICLLQQVVRQQETITALEAELAGTENACNMHADINRAVADALGQKIGETWHDLGRKVAALKTILRELVEAGENVVKIDQIFSYWPSIDMGGNHGGSIRIPQGEKGKSWHDSRRQFSAALASAKKVIS